MQFLTPDQINAIKRIIAKRHSAVILRVLGPGALTQEEKELLEQAGIPIYAQEQAIRDAYLFGQYQAKHAGEPDLSYDQFKKKVEKNPIVLSQAEEFAVQAAELHAGAHIRHLGAKIEQQTSMLVFKEDAELRSKLLREIIPEVAQNIQKRESIGKLKKELGWLQQDWSRDWNRVAITEKTNAMNRGTADAMRASDGDPWVFKRPMPDACPTCVRLHIGPDGHPRIFKLSHLESNGTNVGKKQADWLPIVGTVHPHCHPEGTGILTPDGEVPIEHVTPGMMVVAHDGSAQKVTSVWSQAVETEMVTIWTNGGVVRATPEHQLLTSSGWVAASSLTQNAQNLVRVGLNVEDQAELVAQHEPSYGLEEGRFARVLLLLSGTGMPVTAIDFDGHLFVWKRQIDVEDVDGVVRVRLKPAPDQRIAHRGFVGPVHLSGSTLRAGDEDFVSFAHTPAGLVSGGHVRFESLGISSFLSGGDAAWFSASLSDAEGYGPTSDPESLCYLLHRTQLIEVHPEDGKCVEVAAVLSHERVVSVSSQMFQGRVWNLTVQNTESYVANGIASHNCQCQLLRVPEGWGFDEESDLVPGGRFGVRYDAEGSVQKAITLEDQLQKAFQVQERISFHGLPIAIENAAGSIRPWVDADGTEGETRMLFAYGYIEGTLGPDGDEYDVFVGPDPLSDEVYIIHQNDPTTGEWDEDKAMIGFPDSNTAKEAYLVHYDNPAFYGSMTILPFWEFVQKVFQTKVAGSFQSDGMVKSYGTPSEVYATGSQMGNRNISQSSTGVALVLGMPAPTGAATPATQIKKMKEHLAGFTDEDRQRLIVPIDASTYAWQDGEPEEAVFPFVHKLESRAEMDAEVLADIPRNKFLLDTQIAKRLHQPATNLVIKSAPSGAPPQAGHKYLKRDWMEDHWVYTYAEQNAGKVEGHDHDHDLVVLKLPRSDAAKLVAFRAEHGLKFQVMMGSKYAMLPVTKEEAEKLRAKGAPQAQHPLVQQPAAKANLEVLQQKDLVPVQVPQHILQHGQAVTVKKGDTILKGTIVGFDGDGLAVFTDEHGQRRLAPWKDVRPTDGVRQEQVNAYDSLPKGAIRKATPEHAQFVKDALSETMIQHGKPTSAYLDWLHSHGVEAYMVGGFVRDLLSGVAAGDPPEKIRGRLKDHDIVASAGISTAKAMFKEVGHGELGGWHTAGVVIAYGPHHTDGVDFASMSQDGFFDWEPKPHQDSLVATPPVTWDQDLMADSRRRDFTANSVYYDTRNQVFLDPSGRGIEDAQNKFLRVIAGKKELAKNHNIAIRFWKFRLRGFTSDPENTKLMIKSFAKHAKLMSKAKLATELAKAAGKGTVDPKPFLAKLKAIMTEDGAGDLYTKHIQPIESLVTQQAAEING